MMTDKFNIFDVFSTMLPGMILLCLAYVCMPNQILLFIKEYGAVGKLLLFFIFSYLYGLLLHEIGYVINKAIIVKRMFGDEPRSIYKDSIYVLRNQMNIQIANAVYKDILSNLDTAIVDGLDDKQKQHLVFSLCMNYLDLQGKNNKADKFATLSEFGRSMYLGIPITILTIVILTMIISSGFPIHTLLVMAGCLLTTPVFWHMHKKYEQFRYSTIIRCYYLDRYYIGK